MVLFNPKIALLKSERGVGLIILLIAAALVVTLAAVVATFVSNQNRTSAVIAKSADCSNIANSVSDYLKKDESSLFINTIGIDADGTFANYSNALTNVDGNSRFGFMQNTPVVSMSASTIDVIEDGQPKLIRTLPTSTTVSLYNYLNIDTSFNRILSLANTANICGSEGVIYENNDTGTTNTLIDGITIERPNVRVLMTVAVLEGGNSLCNEGQLTRLPSLNRGVVVTYNIKAVVNSNLAQPSSCTASGTVILGSDTVAPLTVMHINSIENAGRCDTAAGIPNTQYCIAGARRQTADIIADVYTVTDTTACRNCLGSTDAALNIDRYGSCTPNVPNLPLVNRNLGDAAVCGTTCVENDPGSVFFCKLTHREQTTGLNAWWPCHQKPSSVPGTVSIAYEDISGDLDTTQRTTRATIRVSNLAGALPPARDWLLDVRAVDSSGQSFGVSALTAATQFASVPSGYPVFRDCSCDGSCIWTSQVVTTCPAVGPACPVGVPNGTLTRFVPAQYATTTNVCTYPGTTDVIADENCYNKQPGDNDECELPCVGPPTPPNYYCTYGGLPYGVCAGTPSVQSRTGLCMQDRLHPIPDVVVAVSNCANSCYEEIPCVIPTNYVCDFTGIPFGACTGTPGTESRTGVCMDTAANPNVAVGVSNCTNSCYEENNCGATPTYTCENYSVWTTCTPTCTQSCEETRSGTCQDQDGNPTAGMCGTSNCAETRTNFAEGCTYSCDTSAAVASTCSDGPCNLPGEITYSGSVCKDSNGVEVDISNCGGNCNPAPTSCDRGCTAECVPVAPGLWTPLSCPGAPTDCGTQTSRSRTTTCEYREDHSACTTVCTDETETCPMACSDCGTVAHGGFVETNTYTSSTNSCEQRACIATPFRQDCNNGVLTPASLPVGAILSCTPNPLTDGTWDCVGGRVPGGSCPGSSNGSGTPTPYFSMCGREDAVCKQSNGQPADCCVGNGYECGYCTEHESQTCKLNSPFLKFLYSSTSRPRTECLVN